MSIQVPFVIACGDEGVQVNVGIRLGLVGAGAGLEHNTEIIEAIKKTVGDNVVIAASSQNDWIKQTFRLDDFEQADATMQQQVAALADRCGIKYAGFMPFTDPQQLEHGVKGHMVRPQGIHIGTKIILTLGGGEQKFHLGHYLVSADWVAAADKSIVLAALKTQIEFYRNLIGDKKAPVEYEMQGVLGEKIAAKNKAVLDKLGIDKI